MDSTTLSEIHRAAAELTTDFVFALRVTDDGRMRVQWVSPGIAGLTGFPVEEMGGPGGWEGLIPEEDRVVLGHRNETLLGGQTAVCEYRLVTRTGEVRWMRETSRPIRSAPGGPVSAVYGAACEITDHRQEVEASRSSQERPRSHFETRASELITANRQLQRELEECRRLEADLLRFKIIADEASYGIAIADLEGVLLYVNDGFARMHNHTPDELVGRHLSVFHTDEQLPRVNALLDRLRKDGLVTVEEVWHKRRDGSVFPTLMNASVIEGEDGAPLFLSATAIDITEHRRAEEELRVSQQELQAIYDGVVDGILIADAETGALIRANSAMGGMLGYSEGELLGISVAEILPSEDRARLLAEFAEVAEGRRTFASEVPVACKDRNVLLVDISARPIRYRGRSCVIGFFRDVTERKRAEDAIRESERHLRSVLDGLGPHILVGVMTPDGVLIEANEPGLNIGNVKPEDVLGKPCEETYWFCHSPAVQQKLRDSIRRAAQGEPCRYDMVIRVGEDRSAVI
ncbi:MAG: PAS domain S-box protein, partial [bacterium]|nr:PAS domain S-box protein [bacterium]